jgi:hypothetical protein
MLRRLPAARACLSRRQEIRVSLPVITILHSRGYLLRSWGQAPLLKPDDRQPSFRTSKFKGWPTWTAWPWCLGLHGPSPLWPFLLPFFHPLLVAFPFQRPR